MYVLTTILAVLATHFNPRLGVVVGALHHPSFLATSYTAFVLAPLVYLAQVAPLLCLSAFIFQEAFLLKHWRALAGCGIVIAGFSAVRATEKLWERWVIGPAIFATRVVLYPFVGWDHKSIFSPYLSLGAFRVKVEAACSGLQWVFLFTAAYVCIWVVLANRAPLSRLRSAVGLIGGIVLLYVLNGIRIALLLAIGSRVSSQASVDLFHSLLGAVLSFLVFLGYVWWVIPWIRNPQRA